MEELLIEPTWSKEKKYAELIPQIKSVVEIEEDVIANLANVSAMLKEAFNFWWVGFYLNRAGELVLGPFQGPLACTRIKFGKGVCGTSALQKKTIIVSDVEAFPGHIACSAASKSEIVIPLIQDNETVLILDVDSDSLDDFDQYDQHFLEQLIDILNKQHPNLKF